jgi:hypothetical protein
VQTQKAAPHSSTVGGTNEQEIVFGVISQFGKLKNGKIYQIEDLKNSRRMNQER